MRLPRDVSGGDMIKKLEGLGYQQSRQTGSHVRLTCSTPAKSHITVPLHGALRLGTLSSILNDVAIQQKIPRDQLIEQLFS